MTWKSSDPNDNYTNQYTSNFFSSGVSNSEHQKALARIDDLKAENVRLQHYYGLTANKISKFEEAERKQQKAEREKQKAKKMQEAKSHDDKAALVVMLRNKNFLDAYTYAKKNNAMSELALCIEDELKAIEGQAKDVVLPETTNLNGIVTLQDLLFAVYISLPPENTDLYEKRCMSAIEDISQRILQSKEENDGKAARVLERARLGLYFNLYNVRRDTPGTIYSKEAFIRLLANGGRYYELDNTETINTVEEMILELPLRLSEAKQELQKYKLNSKLSKEIDDLPEPSDKIDVLKTKLAAATEEKMNLATANRLLRGTNTTLRQQIGLLSSNLKQVGQEHKELTDKHQNLTERHNKLTAKAEQVVSVHDKLQEKVKNVEAENKTLLTNNQSLLQKNSDLKEEAKVQNAKMQLQEQSIKDLKKEVEDLKQQLATLTTTHNALKDENSRISDENTALKNQLKTDNQKIIDSIKNDIKSFMWKKTGGKRIASTSTARFILGIIEKHEKLENRDNEKDAKCLEAISGAASQGKNRNIFYKFFHRQNESSRKRYQDYIDLIERKSNSLR